jgi:hypothetical protein
VDAGDHRRDRRHVRLPGDVTVKLRVTDDAGWDGRPGPGRPRHARPHGVVQRDAESGLPSPISELRRVGPQRPDVGGSIAKYEWDLDGNEPMSSTAARTPTVQRAYDTGGTVAVKLRVTDADGAKATHSVNVVASNTLPFASLTATPNPVAAGAPVLPGRARLQRLRRHDRQYDWDLDGNGSFETTTGATPTRSHTYPNAATFQRRREGDRQ